MNTPYLQGVFFCNKGFVKFYFSPRGWPLLYNFTYLKKAATILLLSYYSFGIFCLPMGDFSRMAELPGMYQHCKEEDPDINILDFVGEHLMNLENIIDHFEHDEEQDKNEQPHQPYHFAASAAETMYIFSPATFNHNIPAEIIVTAYFSHHDNSKPQFACTEIFHPPSLL